MTKSPLKKQLPMMSAICQLQMSLYSVCAHVPQMLYAIWHVIYPFLITGSQRCLKVYSISVSIDELGLKKLQSHYIIIILS